MSEPLTARQVEVLQLMAEGLNAGEIAARLGLRLCTVRHHREHVKNKLTAVNAPNAVKRGYELGYLGGGA